MTTPATCSHLNEKAASEPTGLLPGGRGSRKRTCSTDTRGNLLLNNLRGCDPDGSGGGTAGLAARIGRKVELERVDFLAMTAESSKHSRKWQVEPGRTAGQLRLNDP